MALFRARLRRAISLSFFLMLLPPVAGTALAEPELRLSPDVAELTRGIICAPPPAGRREAPDTAFGWIHVPDESITIRREASTVPAVLGMGFGMRYRLHSKAPRLLRYVVEHPPMPPHGRTRQSWEGYAQDEEGWMFFQFDLEEELLPGTWSLSAHDGPQELFHAAFQVVEPEALPELAGLCGGEELLALISR